MNGPGNATLNLPATASAGFLYDVSKTFSLQGEAAWTGWSVFKDLTVTFPSGQPADVTDESWKDTWFVSLGGICKPSKDWSFKVGLAYDRSPVDTAHRTPRIPDADRTWVTLGASWYVSNSTTLDFAAAKLFAPTVNLGLQSGTTPTAPNFYRGNLTGTYNVGATILAASARFRF
jgi:long-chain fatty acid transport protein